jgi:cytochrome P450
MTAVFDPRRPEIAADPYPVFTTLREHDPVHRSDVVGGVVLTRFADVRACLTDPRLSSDRITPFVRHRAGRHDAPLIETLGRTLGLWAVFTDPPKHTRLRALMNRAFTTRAVERLRPRIEAIVEDLLARVRGRGAMDLIQDFAYPLPIAVIGDMIGVPAADRDLFKQWSDDLATFVGSAVATPDKYERAAASLGRMQDYFRSLLAERRAAPRDDLATALLAAEEQDDRMSEDEIVATAILLLFAGHETTTNLIGNGMLALLRNPRELERLRAAPGLAASAVEEMLRYDGPSGAMTRVAVEDVTLDGVTVTRGERLFLMINAANRDPRQFDDADRFDAGREPNRHIAFGAGIHFCVGAPLARLEAQIAVPALAALPDLALASDAPLDWLDSLVFRGLRALPVTFRPAAT